MKVPENLGVGIGSSLRDEDGEGEMIETVSPMSKKENHSLTNVIPARICSPSRSQSGHLDWPLSLICGRDGTAGVQVTELQQMTLK